MEEVLCALVGRFACESFRRKIRLLRAFRSVPVIGFGFGLGWERFLGRFYTVGLSISGSHCFVRNLPFRGNWVFSPSLPFDC